MMMIMHYKNVPLPNILQTFVSDISHWLKKIKEKHSTHIFKLNAQSYLV